MFGQFCPYKEILFCQEQAGCLNCRVYEDTVRKSKLTKRKTLSIGYGWGVGRKKVA